MMRSGILLAVAFATPTQDSADVLALSITRRLRLFKIDRTQGKPVDGVAVGLIHDAKVLKVLKGTPIANGREPSNAPSKSKAKGKFATFIGTSHQRIDNLIDTIDDYRYKAGTGIYNYGRNIMKSASENFDEAVFSLRHEIISLPDSIGKAKNSLHTLPGKAQNRIKGVIDERQRRKRASTLKRASKLSPSTKNNCSKADTDMETEKIALYELFNVAVDFKLLCTSKSTTTSTTTQIVLPNMYVGAHPDANVGSGPTLRTHLDDETYVYYSLREQHRVTQVGTSIFEDITISNEDFATVGVSQILKGLYTLSSDDKYRSIISFSSRADSKEILTIAAKYQTFLNQEPKTFEPICVLYGGDPNLNIKVLKLRKEEKKSASIHISV